jgi:uncharacterized protein YaiI (UPF0178 family)
MHVPSDQRVTLMVVKGVFDAADDWIVEHVDAHDIVVTADILLADRCLKKGALVVGPTGKPFTVESIGSAVAIRDLMAELRSSGEMTGGPLPLKKQDRSRFLHQLDEMIQSIRRAQRCQADEISQLQRP